MVQLSYPYLTIGKTIALSIQNFVFCITFLIISIPHQSGAFVTTAHLQVSTTDTSLAPKVPTLHEGSLLILYILWTWTNVSTIKVINHSNFTALKILCAQPVYPSLPPTLSNYWLFYYLQSFVFSKISCTWNQTLFSLFKLTSFS